MTNLWGRFFRRLSFGLLFGWMVVSVASADTQKESTHNSYSFGVVPQQSASQLAKVWGPFLAEVGKRAGVDLVFRTAPNIPSFEENLGTATYDFAYMNPYHYVVFHEAAGYQAYAKERDKKLKGIIVVRKDSPYKHIAELAGKEVAFPAPAAFAASIMTQAEFGQHGIVVNSKFVSSPDSVYRAVASGLVEAGGGIPRTFDAIHPEVREQLRILVETQTFTPHALAAQSRVPKSIVDRVAVAMLSMSDDETGRILLSALSFKNGLVAAQDRDWNDIRKLDLHMLEKYTRE